MKKLRELFMIILVFILTGCVNPHKPLYEGESGAFEEGSELEGNEEEQGGINPFEDKLFIKEGEKIILKTNNLKYWGVRGYTLWKFLGEEIDKKRAEHKGYKKEGASEAGYGLVCYRAPLKTPFKKD